MIHFIVCLDPSIDSLLPSDIAVAAAVASQPSIVFDPLDHTTATWRFRLTISTIIGVLVAILAMLVSTDEAVDHSFELGEQAISFGKPVQAGQRGQLDLPLSSACCIDSAFITTEAQRDHSIRRSRSAVVIGSGDTDRLLATSPAHPITVVSVSILVGEPVAVVARKALEPTASGFRVLFGRTAFELKPVKVSSGIAVSLAVPKS